MSIPSIAHPNSRFRSFAQVGSVVVFLVGCLALMGWVFNIDILKSILPGAVTMKANTAVCFLLAGASLWLALNNTTDRRIHRLGQAFAIGVALIGLLTLSEYLFGWDLGIDQLLFKEPLGAIATAIPGRMAPNTALNFILLGFGLLFLDWETRSGYRPAQFLTVTAGVIALLGLLGYAFGVMMLYGFLNYTPMAINTAAAFTILCLSMLSARPTAGLMAVITNPAAGGLLARRLLLVALIVPAALGWMRLLGERAGFYDTPFGTSLTVVANTAIFVIMIFSTARLLNKADAALQQANADLEKRVTERTAELIASERNFRDLSDSALIGIYRTSLKGEILYVNATLARILGFDSPEALMREGALARYRDPQDRQTFLERLQRDGKVETFETVLLTCTGEPRNILMSAALHSNQMIGNLVDITERKRAEDALRKSEERYRQTLDSMMEGCQIIGFDWRYLYVNDVVAGHGHKTKEELLGRTMMEVYPGIEKTEMFAVLHRCMEERISQHMENEFRYPDGAKGWFDLSIQPAPEGIFILSIDITERKRAEADRLARMAAEQANQAKSEFLSRMSHELRTPLNSILGFTQLLEMDALTPDQTDSLGHIIKSGRHLLDLINEVLDIARIEGGRMKLSPEPVQVDETIQEAVDIIRPLAEKRGITIQIKVPSSRDVFVTADRQRLKQVLLNLLSNAVKYNREGGEIHILASLLVDGFLHLAVRDTGEGIPPEKMGRLFIPFERLGLEPAVIEGTGLGLALSKGLVEAMGGRIGAQSAVGEGSTFWLDLQLTTQQKEVIVMAEVDDYLKTTPGSKKGLVLYVEDNLSNIQLIEKILARLPDVELISAMQGRLAMDLARQHKPALILLDLHLPDVHGSDVLQWLRAEPETKGIPVVIMSADATQGQIERMLAAGANAYLTKPIDVKEFLKLVGETMGK